jgi:hypothetical protein
MNRGIAKEMLRDSSACSDFKQAVALGTEQAKQYINDCE